MQRKKSFKNKLIIILVIALIIVAGFSYNRMSIDRQTNLLSNTIEEQISNIVELSTVQYNYTNIVEYNDNLQFKNLNLPFTNKNFIVKYDGYIKAGIDLESVDIDVKDRDNIDISMNKAEILENVISEEDVYFYNEKDSVFNKLKFDDLYSVLVEEKQKMKEEITEKGILNDAEKNGEKIMVSLLRGMGFENISISFK